MATNEITAQSQQAVLDSVKAEARCLGSQLEIMMETIQKLQQSLETIVLSDGEPQMNNQLTPSITSHEDTMTESEDQNGDDHTVTSTVGTPDSVDVSQRTLEKMEEVLVAIQEFSYREKIELNEKLRIGLGRLRFECFKFLVGTSNKPEFQKLRSRWNLKVFFETDYSLSLDRKVPCVPPLDIEKFKNTYELPEFIETMTEDDLSRLSNGLLGGPDLKWLRDKRIGFPDNHDYLYRYRTRTASDPGYAKFDPLAGLLLQDRFANQRDKVRSIFKYVTGKEIEEMDCDAWIFES